MDMASNNPYAAGEDGFLSDYAKLYEQMIQKSYNVNRLGIVGVLHALASHSFERAHQKLAGNLFRLLRASI
jgi:hypothetical protein